jgi:hypothetical protein
MKFDLSAIPPGAVVTDATLQLALVASDAAAENTYTVTAHKVVSRNPVITGATGYTADGVTAWTPNTCCSSNVPLAQADISAAYDSRAIDKTLGYKSWSLTAMVQEWLASPATNLGLLLDSDASKLRDRYRYFASMENADPALRPSLRVTYSLSPDVTPPVISAVTASAITISGAAINWTTDEPSDSQVENGTSAAYGSLTTLSGARVTSHAATLTGLAADTLYHFRVRSRDLAGNLALSGDFTLTTLADLTPPAVSITAPTMGATATGMVTVAASASDNVAVAGVQFKLDGANLGAEDAASPYSVSWNTLGVASGSHTLTAVARDAAGNVTTSAVVTVTVSNDTTPPSISITAPGGGTTVSATITVTAGASDNVGVVGVQFKLDGANLGAEDTSSSYSVSWTTTTALDGSHTLTAVARDAAGNATTSAAVAVTVANGGVVTLAPQDTFLNLDTTNQSTNTQLMTYTWPDNKVANAILMKFDLSSVPAGATVTDATLQVALLASDAKPETTYTITANKVVAKNPVITAATGYTSDGVTPWTPNACCDSGVPLAQADISPPYDTRAVDKTLGYKTWAVTAIVQEWLANPAANFGLLLNSDASKLADRYRFFASMEYADPLLRPSLRITYSLIPDVTPPVISGVTSTAITASRATINWTTDEQSDSQVEYGTTTAYGSLTALNSSRVISHSATLGGLAASTLYHFRVRSRDFAGNLAVSGDFTFTTLAADLTPPSVSITAPTTGATVTGTVTVTANATDNVGVAGVQFKLDGANLGAEDTSSPYSVSWNSASAANGAHTLSAVARDAAGNQATSAAVTVTVSNSGGGIAAQYPGDVGIEANPDVIFVERFDETTLSALFGRWTDIRGSGNMLWSTDVPPGSPINRSLDIRSLGSSNDGGHLYKQLTPGIDDTLYVRYYIKYPTNTWFNHTGVWMGGFNPLLGYPNPQAGTRPVGNDRFMAGAEENTITNGFDHYDYWMNMHQSADGNFWGNYLLNNPNVDAASGGWTCVEHMVKLNNPVTAFNGEHAIWLNGVKVSHLGLGFPNGTWSSGIFTQNPAGSPFEGFRWRSDTALNLNWIWLQNYASGLSGDLLFGHLVAARSRIGCLVPVSGDTTAPAVSVTSPASGAVVSNTATVSATATDNVGVAGVQFKLDGTNLAAEDTASPYSVSWNTALASNGQHTLTAVARDGAGNTKTSAPVTVDVSNGAAGAWPNEPAGFTTYNDQPWNALTGNGWNYLRRTSSQDASIVTDATAPFSPSNVLRIVYTTDMAPDSEPSVHWISLPSPKEIYTGWWVKLSPNWIPNPAGGGKMTFLFTLPGGGQVYTNFYHPSTDGSVQGPPYRVGANTEWAPYGQKIWYPNVATNWINNGEWHRIEFYYRWETTPGVSGDGIIRWWVDGILNGDHRNVHYPAVGGFEEFQHAPTVQFAGVLRYMYVDHTHISRP